MSERGIISNLGETKFLRSKNGSLEVVAHIEQAAMFESKKAQNILVNMPKNLKNMGGWKIIKVEQEHDSDMSFSIDHTEQMSNQEFESCVDKPMTYDKNEILKIIFKTAEEIQNEKRRLNNKLIKVSRAITDYNHFKEQSIRKSKRSASQRCKDDIFFEKLITTRRQIKDELELLSIISNLVNVDNLTESKKELDQFQHRFYKPRALYDLFETKEFPNFEEWYNNGLE